jgi:hypothetical protein
MLWAQGVRMDDQMTLQSEEAFQTDEQKVFTTDWTESEWFEIWLKLARGEYDSAG